MLARTLLVVTILAILAPQAARADDFGPRRAVSAVRFDVRRLLAHRVRTEGVNPKDVAITDVVVVGNQAIASWDSGKSHAVMGLLYHDDRWWDAYDARRVANGAFWLETAFPPLNDVSDSIPISPDAHVLSEAGFKTDLVAQAALHNADVRGAVQPNVSIRIDPLGSKSWTLYPQGGMQRAGRRVTAGYELTFHFSRNDAASALPITQIYARAPTHAEFLPFPTPPKEAGGPTDVGYFDLDVGGSKPVTFTQGTTVDVWFPFVLDDSLRYDISLYTNHKSFGPYHGTIFDNVLHFVLPAFTIVPGTPLQAEISGWY